MPELPEVEAVCRKLRAEAAGSRIVQMRIERPGIVKPFQPAVIERAVAGRTLQAVERRGKNILLWLDSGEALHVHLRMTGNLYVIPDVRFRPTAARVWWELEGGRGLIFEDSRALGRIRLLQANEVDVVLKDVGMEPFSADFTPAYWIEQAARSRKPAKLFLMDQRYVAGLGNIYVAEALFRARVHPRRPVNALRRARLAALHEAIREVLLEAVDSAVAAYNQPGRFVEGEAFSCAVYGREGKPCVRCNCKIKRIVQGGRSTFFCSRCQR